MSEPTFIMWMLNLPRRFVVGMWGLLVRIVRGYSYWKPIWFLFFAMALMFSTYFTSMMSSYAFWLNIGLMVLCFAYSMYLFEVEP